MAKLLSDPEFQRFADLQQKQSSFTITSEEADELRDIVARAQKKRDDRALAMQAIEAHIAQFDISPDELFSSEQIGDAARVYGLIPASRKERVLPPQLVHMGKPYQWTARPLPDDIRLPLFEAFTTGASIKVYLATPRDAHRCAVTIARLEKETSHRYADDLLEELALTRRQIDDAGAKPGA
ncbi:hypothetical protein OVY01_02360 [Robbsia sp. Bb-Pol-6]|uniref:Uncharacterized protein n=1 Tax=Robbsia betulipollinis TaxID=2981849 RepID=A0ABT3ZHV4_9BURK|nr:hypothetical protein [Robbsia betulipollinis]MCY0386106.1 hypothetical protein [Robbsia betulipollinis]